MKSKDIFLKEIKRHLPMIFRGLGDIAQLDCEAQVRKLQERIEFYVKAMNSVKESEAYRDELNNMIYEMVGSYDEGRPVTFADHGRHSWFLKKKEQIEFVYGDAYLAYLADDLKWDVDVIGRIDVASDDVLDHCGDPDPAAGDSFAVKGLVIGDIQSGKTASYTSLINKAVDAGYRLIIVLTGMMNDLRSQTQRRLDREFLGYESIQDSGKGQAVGVGRIRERSLTRPNCLTDASLEGDLKSLRATFPLNPDVPLLIVSKKNQAVLAQLIDFIRQNPTVVNSGGRLDLPVLIIDDEADQASLNTRKSSDVQSATRINRQIRTLLALFRRYSFVGYTATPFANAFIDAFAGQDVDEQDRDIFPEDFIVCLQRSPNYCGVGEFFGEKDSDAEDEDAFNLDLFRPIREEDVQKIFGSRISVGVEASGLSDCLKEAIMRFLIVSAVRRSRGFDGHHSMLIHVTHYQNPSKSLKQPVMEELQRLRIRYMNGGDEEFRRFWEEKIRPVSQKRLGKDFKDDWDVISPSLEHVMVRLLLRSDCVIYIGSKTNDCIDYHSNSDGLHIIIGGNKLSRGLTLEGLLVSYYCRRARAYDTLLQMGRWFGYRDGWLDLCRVYTTMEIMHDFVSSAEALESFRKDIRAMNEQRLTPREFGLKVMSSPKLVPTSPGKMRHAEKRKLSFSGELQQTITFNPADRDANRQLVIDFLKDRPHVRNQNGRCVFRDIPVTDVLSFLQEYHECVSELTRISVRAWRDYIVKLSGGGELVSWTVVLHSLTSGEGIRSTDQLGPFTIIKPRHRKRLSCREDVHGIKVLTNPSNFLDFFEDGDDVRSRFTHYEPYAEEIRRKFTARDGLLVIYDFDITEETGGEVCEGGAGTIGLGLWFPVSASAEATIDYYVNDVFVQNGGRELADEQSAEEEYDD